MADDTVDSCVGAFAGRLDVSRGSVLHSAKDLQDERLEVLRGQLHDSIEDLGHQCAVDHGDSRVNDLLRSVRVRVRLRVGSAIITGRK